jgi:hypothetical protein
MTAAVPVAAQALPVEVPTPTSTIPFRKIIDDIDQKTGAFSTIQTLALETAHLSPFFLTAGLFTLGVLTMNLPVVVMSVTMVEALFLRLPLQGLANYFMPLTADTGAGLTDTCVSGYARMTPPMLSTFLNNGLKEVFPLPSLYVLGTAFSYTFFSMLQFSEEATKLGPSYSNRPYLAAIGSTIFLLAFSLYLYTSQCQTITTILITILLGLFLGYVLQNQNSLLFGDKSAINISFMPQLTPVQPAYFCAELQK